MEKISTRLYRIWYRRRHAAVISLLAFLVAYVVASRAIETGSLQQYGLTIILVAVGVNRFFHALRRR